MAPVRRSTHKSAAAPRNSRPANRDERFTARIARSEKSLLQKAAERRGQTLSAYVFEKARSAAILELEEAGELILAPAEQRRFVELILSPPKANANLRRALHAAGAHANAE